MVQDGRLDAWKAQLGHMWLEQGAKGPGPSVEDIESMLLDSSLFKKLQKVDGPWEVLRAQANSHRGHKSVGDALLELSEILR
jgi:hypothetical protein